MDLFGNYLTLLKGKIRKRMARLIVKTRLYVKHLLFPLYLFPIKIVTFSTFYLAKYSLKLFWYLISWPFRRWTNFFKTIVWAIVATYLFFSLLVIIDYINRNYGNYTKFFCGVGLKDKLRKSVVRIVGGLGEGSGFFISENQVVTNFHVIADEPSPKIIFADGTFVTPVKIVGDATADIAVLYTQEKYPDLVFETLEPLMFYDEEPLLAAGYALGTSLPGMITIQEGKFADFRSSKYNKTDAIQTDINLVPGMSGGPLVEKCGKVVGINTAGLAGLSLFIDTGSLKALMPTLTDAGIAKIEVDASTPEGAVIAFYTYLKARRMQDGFNLLSEEYLKKTNFEEWTNRFTDILDVEVYGTKMEDEARNSVFVKFATSNWVDGEIDGHYYEGTWQTVEEAGIYKMNRSNIKEVSEPDVFWFYEI